MLTLNGLFLVCQLVALEVVSDRKYCPTYVASISFLFSLGSVFFHMPLVTLTLCKVCIASIALEDRCFQINLYVFTLFFSRWEFFFQLLGYTDIFFIVRACVNHTWAIVRACVNHTWTIVWACVNHTWTIVRACVNHTWAIVRACVNHTWTIVTVSWALSILVLFRVGSAFRLH